MHPRPLTVAVLMLSTAIASAPVHAATPGCGEKATAMIDALARSDFNGATRDLGGFMRMMFQPAQLKDTWTALTGQYGDYRSHGTAEVSQQKDGSGNARIPLVFAHGQRTAVINCSADEHDDIASFSVM